MNSQSNSGARVNTKISEYNLVTQGIPYSIKTQRVFPKHLLQIIWIPFNFNKEENKWNYTPSINSSRANNWSLPAAIFIDYDVNTLTRRNGKNTEENKQYHATTVAAFELLIYCCLWHIINRLKQEVTSDFTTLMLRLQEQGKESDAKSGDTYIYAASQTLEAILAEDTNIRMQGIVLKNLNENKNNTKYIKKNIFSALLAAFPLIISTPEKPVVEKIGLISYFTRFCDDSISLSADEKSYLFLTQSYIATAVSSPFSGYELKTARKQSDIVDTPEKLKKQRLEISRYARYIDARGVFSRVCAEVEGEEFLFSSKIKNALLAFSGVDKPLFKLCQASSYTERLLKLLTTQGRLQRPCSARAIAITSNGCESIAAIFSNFSNQTDPRVELMKTLGQAYRNISKSHNNQTDVLEKEIRGVFRTLLQSLPSDFKQQAKQLISEPDLKEELNYRFEENVEGFYNSMQELSREDAILAIEETESLQNFFGGSPKFHFNQTLSKAEKIPLRQIHEAAVITGLNSAQKGKINVIALEGNPGIGKTSAVINFLQHQSKGFLFFYVSPRVVINRDVTAKLAHQNDNFSGILTITTNSSLIKLAPKWYEKQGNKQRTIDSAVVVDGVENLRHPDCNTIFITPAQEHEIDCHVVATTKFKNSLNEREDEIGSISRPGVLKTLATSSRKLLEANPQLNRLVITAAIQGYRALQQKTTIDALDNLFSKKADTKLGQRERLEFSQRIPTIIVMVDELAGDGAGALFIHKLAEWLHRQFIESFDDKKSPFKIILIMADASLSNEVVMNSYLAAKNKAPDKVLISASSGKKPFRVTGTDIKIGIGKYPTLHIMTNSYPASELNIEYSMRFSQVTPEIKPDGIKQGIRQAIRQQLQTKLLDNAYKEIERGLKQGAEQLIFFAQDKVFLRELYQLITVKNSLCQSDKVAILDQSVPPHQRLELVQENRRDKIRVFLMTSSCARGISFPKTDWIIARIPRFNIESALMEVAQLIYRGRGYYTDSKTGLQTSGDDKPRRLVMLINDCIVIDDEGDLSRRWLRQTSDLLTLLMMLRSTIHTRIKGDAGLKRQRIAFVPVGSIGDEELLNLMSDDVQSFMQEAQVFISDNHSDEYKGIVRKTQQLIEQIYANFQLTGKAKDRNIKSYTDYKTVEALTKAVSRTSSRLLPSLENTDLIIPDCLTCIGAFWIENWQERKTEERYSFEGWRQNTEKNIHQLLKLLYHIYIDNDHKFPSKLKRLAKELHTLLKKQEEELGQEYSTLQNLETENIVVSIPLDYPHFWRERLAEDSREQRLEEPEIWQKSLGRTLISQGLVMPVVPKYQTFPWVAVAGQRVFNQLENTFSNRYFMASSELNLLNTILLEDEIE